MLFDVSEFTRPLPVGVHVFASGANRESEIRGFSRLGISVGVSVNHLNAAALAALAQKLGSSKDVQGVMRHERTDTTENIYQQILLPSVRTTLDAIHAKLSKKEGLAPGPNPDGPSAPGTAAMPDASKDDVVVMPAVRAEGIQADQETAPAKPVRGVVLKFAPKLPTREREEVLLNA
jgi:hypothetical protein